MAVAPYITGMPGSRAAHAPRQRVPVVHPHLLNSHVVLLPFVAIAVAAYLLGSIPTGYLLYRLFRRQDIRSLGSGNIGATNVFRTGGAGLGVATFVLDVLKGCSAVWLGGYLASLWMPAVPLRTAEAFAALCAVLGHMFPIWLKFRGGKGVATGFGVFLIISPWAALASIATFVVVFGITRYVAVASIIGAAAFPVFAWFLVTGARPPFFFAAAIGVSLLIIVKHHQNIRRLFTGTEYRFGAGKPA
ncbi:MAG: glycerol-3-phosphate 1-O-acyltransferase PlsY [Terracidiphilus sp.]